MCWCVRAERSPDKHDHVNPNEHPPMNDDSSAVVRQNNAAGNSLCSVNFLFHQHLGKYSVNSENIDDDDDDKTVPADVTRAETLW